MYSYQISISVPCRHRASYLFISYMQSNHTEKYNLVLQKNSFTKSYFKNTLCKDNSQLESKDPTFREI